MKQLNKSNIGILLILCFFVRGLNISAQDTAKAEPTVTIRYFVKNNSFPYLVVQSGMKTGKKVKPLPAQKVSIYLDTTKPENLLANTLTDESGKAEATIPPAMKDTWANGSKHNFIAVMNAGSPDNEKTASIEITKAKIIIDTSNSDGVRSINVKVMYQENNNWVPAKDVEMKAGISRNASILSAGDDATYTTDSTGAVSVQLKKDSLPGDEKGDIVLAAKVEDNDLYGNLLVEKTEPWGVAFTAEKNFFDQRTLWTTRFRTPFWLLFMAYAIVIGVWGTIIFLVLQIVKIKKLGTMSN
jgi:hypothetical protein